VRIDEDSFATLQVVTPWGERFILKLEPPKPNLPIDLGPHYRVSVRCGWEDCNRLFSLAERGNKLYCSDECREAAKEYRRKLGGSSVPALED
jgi:hypothetical protein